MSQNQHKRQEAKKASRKKSPKHAKTTALVCVDKTPLLEKERKRYQNLIDLIDTSEKDLQLFETEDKAAFISWYSHTFKDDVTTLKNLEIKLNDLARLVISVENEAILKNVSLKRAFRNVMEKRAQEKKMQEELEKLIEESLKNKKEQHSSSSEEKNTGFSGFNPSKSKKIKHTSQTAERKKIYRELARKLHPDVHQGETSPETQLWWQKVQSAYESGNLSELKILATLIEARSTRHSKSIESVSELKSISLEMQKKLNSLKRKLQEAKKDPAWEFSKVASDPIKLEALKLEAKLDTLMAINQTEAEIAYYENMTKSFISSK